MHQKMCLHQLRILAELYVSHACAQMIINSIFYLQTRSRYAPVPVEQAPQDDINTYLKEPPLTTQLITDAGGYMEFWHQASVSRPSVARMGSDLCSAPGKPPILSESTSFALLIWFF